MTYFNYLGQAMPESASPTNNVYGTSAGHETLTAPAGPSSVDSNGGTGDLLIGSNGDNIFYVKDASDIVRVDAGLSGIKTVVAYTNFTLPANVQNLASSGAFNYAAGNDLNNLITVGNDAETLYGGKGDDVLVGGAGANTFIVKAGEGNDVIYGWNSGDQIQLAGTSFKSFADVQAAMTQHGSDVVLQLDPSETLTFHNVTPGAFASGQFLLPLDRSKLGAVTFSDEFDSFQKYNFSNNTGHWQTNFGFDPHNPNNYSLLQNGEMQMYVTGAFQGSGDHPLGYEPFSVSNGVLTMTAMPIAASDQSTAYGGQYASGMIDTRGIFEQKFGYFEIKMALPTQAAGAWPAFWLAPDPNTAGIEADISENIAINPNIDFVRGYGGAGNAAAFSNVLKTGDVAGFHTYGMMWTPQTVTFYYDDQAVYQAPTPSTWTGPMYLIANLAIGGFGGTPDPSKFPAGMQIDYIHVYGLPDNSQVVENLTPLAPGGTLHINGGVVAGQPGLAVQTFADDGTAVTTRQVVHISTDPQHASATELDAAGAKSLLIWDSGGAVFASYKDGSTYSSATPIAVGTVSGLQMTGGFLSDGKAVLDWVQSDNGVQHAWADVIDVSNMGQSKQQLGVATGGVKEVATAHGGFAISWHNGSEIDARGYDGYGYYGDPVTVSGEVAGINSAGDVVFTWTDASGQHSQLYDVLQDPFNDHTGAGGSPPPPPPTSPPPVSPPPVSPPPVSPPPVSPPPVSPPPVSPPPVSPPPSSDGQTITATTTPATLNGGAGDDTLVASSGPDQLTGGGGADVFRFGHEPWAPAHITDFTVGTDKLDLTALFQASGYAGSDPVADHYVVLQADGSGGTQVLFDPDGTGAGHQWPDYIIDLVGTQASTWAQLSGGTTASPPPVSPPPVSPPPVSPPPASPPPVSPPPVSPPPVSPPPSNGGQVITATTTPATLTGGAGDDTLIASQGADQLTGGGGADVFRWGHEPWAPAQIMDFTPGTDRIDISALLQASGYSGSDPIADHYVVLQADGHGGTSLLFDPDGSATGHPWPDYIIDILGVQVTNWTQASGGATTSPPPPTSPPPTSPPPPPPPPTSPPPPPSSGGQTLTGSGNGSNLVGGSGDDTLIAGHGADTMTGAGGADHFAFTDVPWSAGHVTDFTHGVDKIDVSGLLAKVGYSGSDPIADGYIKLLDDGHGDTWVYFDSDGRGTADQWGSLVTTLDHVAPSAVGPGDWIIR